MRIVVRILGTDLLEIETGSPAPNQGYSAATAQTEATFGFVPAGVEYDKPQPLT